MKSKLNKTKQSKQYLGRIKNNKYQAAQLGDLCTRKKKKKRGKHTWRQRDRETERETETWWCGTLNFF